MFTFLKTALAKALIRHVLAGAGVWIVSKGLLSQDDLNAAGGAVLTLAAVAHSLWDKRDKIKEELVTLTGPGTKLLLFLVLPAALLTGCAGTQVIDTTSGTGLNTEVSVPIPYSGGQSLLFAKLTAGMWKNAAVIQPVSTNKLTGASASVAQYTKGSATTQANAGVSTNGTASIGGASVDINLITTGDSTITSTNVNLESKQ